MDGTLTGGQVFILGVVTFLLFVFPGIFTICLNFLARRLFGIKEPFR
jgi:hypothetical protein